MNEFKTLKKFIWLPLVVVLLQSCTGCFREVVDKGFAVNAIVFNSDTTAMIIGSYWERWEDTGFSPAGNGDRTDYLDLEFKLVDLRYNNIYWSSRTNDGMCCSGSIWQWSDSTILMERETALFLWKIGEKKPNKVNFNLEELEIVDKKTLRLQIYPNGSIFDRYELRQWKNETILMRTYWKDKIPEYLLLDKKNFVISVWQPSAEERKLIEKGAFWDGEKFIYLENECKNENLSCCYKTYDGSLCECLETEPCKAFVFSGSGDTLHTMGHYPYIERQESFTAGRIFDKRCGFELSFNGKFVSIYSLALPDDYYPYSLPADLLPKDTSNISVLLPKDYYGKTKFRLIKAMIFIDKNKKELLNPDFWMINNLNFINSSEELVRY